MASRSFSELIALFPNLGHQGTWPEGKGCEVDPSLRPILDHVAAGYDGALRKAIAFWVANNENILPFMAERAEAGEPAAMATCARRHAAKVVRSGLAPQEADAVGNGYGRIVKGHADRLMAAVGAPLFPDREVYLHRGEAMLLTEFEERWHPGATLTRPLPLACTLNPDLVPLHFAWKRYDRVRVEFPGEPIASIILRIRIAATPESPLIWAGFVPGSQPETDYRWQQEILAPPGFRITVESHDRMPGATADLYQVEASGSFA